MARLDEGCDVQRLWKRGTPDREREEPFALPLAANHDLGPGPAKNRLSAVNASDYAMTGRVGTARLADRHQAEVKPLPSCC